MRSAVALLALVLSSCQLEQNGLGEGGAGPATGAGAGTVATGASTGAGPGGGGSSSATTSSGGSATTGGGTSDGGGGGAGDATTGAGTTSAGGASSSGGGEGGSPPLLGAAPCEGLALDFVDEDITEALDGTPWILRGNGRAESGGGRLRVEGDDEWVEIHTDEGSIEGCSVTATLASVDLAIVAVANVSALAEWPGAETQRRGVEIQVSGAGTCVMRFGLTGNPADAAPRDCGELPITVRLRHTGSMLCYDVEADGEFDEVACVDAPGPIDAGIGASSSAAFDLSYGPIP